MHLISQELPDWLYLHLIHLLEETNLAQFSEAPANNPTLIHHNYKIIDNLHLKSNFAVVIDVKNPKYLLKILLWSSIGHDVEHYHELPEVNVSVLQYIVLSVIVPGCINFLTD